MKSIKRIGLWIIVVFLALIALGTIPSFSCFTAVITALLIVPIEPWQNFLRKYIKGKIKTIAIVVLVILMLVTLPNVDTLVNTDDPDETTTTTTEPTTEPTTVPTTESTTVPTTTPTAEPTTTPTTDPPHVHNFAAATCTTPRTCSCGTTEGTANGHNWKSATCTASKTCSTCGTIEGSAAGHNWKDATYSAPKTCTKCNATEGSPLEVPGKENYHGHVYTGGNSSTKYHYEANCAGKYSHEITWDEVERRGLGPCGTCVLK